MLNDTVNEHVYTVNKRVSIREATAVNSRPKELRSEIMNHTLPRHRRKNNRRKDNRNRSFNETTSVLELCARVSCGINRVAERLRISINSRYTAQSPTEYRSTSGARARAQQHVAAAVYRRDRQTKRQTDTRPF